MADDIAVVIGCLDLYKPLWKPMCYSLSKYFGDSTWPIFWITNSKRAPCGTTILVGGDHTRWSDRMMRGLKQIKSSIILWVISDHWLSGYPDMSAIKDFAKLVEKGCVDRLRLYPGLDHDFGKPYSPDSRLIVMDRKSPYRCSCKPSFWRRTVLLDLLRSGESPWDFEKNGRRRSEKYTFAITKDWHFYFVTHGCPDGGNWPKSPVVKGKWSRAAQMYCKREGLKVNFSQHPISSDPFEGKPPDYILP